MRRITDVRLPHPRLGDTDQRHTLTLDQNLKIQAIQRMAVGDTEAANNWKGDWICPRGIDLQINGGLGLAFPELTPADLPRLLQLLELLWQDGVEAIAPTLVTCGVAPLRQALAVLREARSKAGAGCCRPVSYTHLTLPTNREV